MVCNIDKPKGKVWKKYLSFLGAFFPIDLFTLLLSEFLVFDWLKRELELSNGDSAVSDFLEVWNRDLEFQAKVNRKKAREGGGFRETTALFLTKQELFALSVKWNEICLRSCVSHLNIDFDEVVPLSARKIC